MSRSGCRSEIASTASRCSGSTPTTSNGTPARSSRPSPSSTSRRQQPVRVGPVVDEVAHAAEARALLQFGEPLGSPLGLVERHVADDAEHDGSGVARPRTCGRCRRRCRPTARARFPSTPAAANSGSDVVHAEVAVEHAGLGTEPGVLGPLEVPDVLVGVDDAAHALASTGSAKDLMNCRWSRRGARLGCRHEHTHPPPASRRDRDRTS